MVTNEHVREQRSLYMQDYRSRKRKDGDIDPEGSRENESRVCDVQIQPGLPHRKTPALCDTMEANGSSSCYASRLPKREYEVHGVKHKISIGDHVLQEAHSVSTDLKPCFIKQEPLDMEFSQLSNNTNDISQYMSSAVEVKVETSGTPEKANAYSLNENTVENCFSDNQEFISRNHLEASCENLNVKSHFHPETQYDPNNFCELSSNEFLPSCNNRYNDGMRSQMDTVREQRKLYMREYRKRMGDKKAENSTVQKEIHMSMSHSKRKCESKQDLDTEFDLNGCCDRSAKTKVTCTNKTRDEMESLREQRRLYMREYRKRNGEKNNTYMREYRLKRGLTKHSYKQSRGNMQFVLCGLGNHKTKIKNKFNLNQPQALRVGVQNAQLKNDTIAKTMDEQTNPMLENLETDFEHDVKNLSDGCDDFSKFGDCASVSVNPHNHRMYMIEGQTHIESDDNLHAVPSDEQACNYSDYIHVPSANRTAGLGMKKTDGNILKEQRRLYAKEYRNKLGDRYNTYMRQYRLRKGITKQSYKGHIETDNVASEISAATSIASFPSSDTKSESLPNTEVKPCVPIDGETSTSEGGWLTHNYVHESFDLDKQSEFIVRLRERRRLYMQTYRSRVREKYNRYMRDYRLRKGITKHGYKDRKCSNVVKRWTVDGSEYLEVNMLQKNSNSAIQPEKVKQEELLSGHISTDNHQYCEETPNPSNRKQLVSSTVHGDENEYANPKLLIQSSQIVCKNSNISGLSQNRREAVREYRRDYMRNYRNRKREKYNSYMRNYRQRKVIHNSDGINGENSDACMPICQAEENGHIEYIDCTNDSDNCEEIPSLKEEEVRTVPGDSLWTPNQRTLQGEVLLQSVKTLQEYRRNYMRNYRNNKREKYNAYMRDYRRRKAAENELFCYNNESTVGFSQQSEGYFSHSDNLESRQSLETTEVNCSSDTSQTVPTDWVQTFIGKNTQNMHLPNDCSDAINDTGQPGVGESDCGDSSAVKVENNEVIVCDSDGSVNFEDGNSEPGYMYCNNEMKNHVSAEENEFTSEESRCVGVSVNTNNQSPFPSRDYRHLLKSSDSSSTSWMQNGQQNSAERKNHLREQKRIYMRNYRAKNREQTNAYMRNYRNRINLEKNSEYNMQVATENNEILASCELYSLPGNGDVSTADHCSSLNQWKSGFPEPESPNQESNYNSNDVPHSFSQYSPPFSGIHQDEKDTLIREQRKLYMRTYREKNRAKYNAYMRDYRRQKIAD